MKPKLTSALLVVFVFLTYMAQANPLSSIGDQIYGTDFTFEISCDSITCDPVDIIAVSRVEDTDTWEAHILRAGTATITAHTEPVSSNLTVPITILPAPLTITVEDKERDYNTDNPEWTVTIAGLQYDDTVESLDFTLTCEASRTEIVGAYEISVILGNNPNYSIILENGWLRIIPVKQTITGITDFTAVYGDVPMDLEVEVSSKLPVLFTSQNTDIAEVKNNQVVFKRAGSTTITVSVQKNINYENVADQEFNVTIDKAPLTLTGRKVIMLYGTIPDVTQLQDSFDVSGWKNDVDATLLAFARPSIFIDNSITSTTPPGLYPGAVILTGMGLQLLNYALYYVPGELEIVKTSGVLTFDSIPSKQYSNDLIPLYVSHSAGGTIHFTSDDPNAFEFVYDDNLQRWNAKTLKAGDYHITAVVEATEYYDYCDATQPISIDKAPLFVTAIDEARFFGEDNSKLNLNYIFGNFVYPKDIDEFITLPTVSVDNFVYGINKPVGTYSGALVVSGGEHPNYELLYQNGTLRIMPLDAVIDFQLLSIIHTYGDVAFPLNATHYRGNTVYFRSSNENVIKVYAQDQGWKAEITGAGTAIIVAFTETENGYMAVETSRTVIVNPAMLTIRPQDAVRKVGERNPIFSVLCTGLVPGDDSKIGNITISCAANESSLPGKYDIVASGAANPNYIITYEKGTLLVTDLAIHELNVSGTKISNPDQEITCTTSCSNGKAADFIEITLQTSTTVSAVTLAVDGEEKGTKLPETTRGICSFGWNTAPGTYTISIRMETAGLDNNKFTNTYVINLIQPLDATPELFYRRWDNVLAINNNPEINKLGRNDDFSFQSYAWYLNNEEQPLSTEGFIKKPADSTPEDEYTVFLTTTEGKTFQTCPVKFTTVPAATVAVYPSIVPGGGTITVNASLPEDDQSNARVEIFNLNGQWINTLMLEGSETLVTMPNLSGNYVLNVVAGTGMSQQFKVIVY